MDRFAFVPWLVWTIDVALFGTLRIMQRRGTIDPTIGLAGVYMLATWLPIMAVHGVYSRHVVRYIRDHHPELWKRLSFGSPAFGGVRPLAGLKWLFSEDDLGNARVIVLKQRAKHWIGFVICVFASLPLMDILLTW
jgi:hypothetical protein